MKPFANITVSDDGNSWIVQVNDTALDGNPFRGMSWETKVGLINAAFEDRLKEEMEKFRERAEKSISDACIDCRGSGTVTEDGHGCDGDDAKCFKICPVPIQRQCGYCDRWVNAIRALPIFETEEKP